VKTVVDQVFWDFNTADSKFATEAVAILEQSVKMHGWHSIHPWEELRRLFKEHHQPTK